MPALSDSNVAGGAHNSGSLFSWIAPLRARPRFGQLGYPTRSVTERPSEGGILARDPGLPPSSEWPVEMAVLDRLIAELPTRHMAAVSATYFHLRDTAKTAVFARYIYRLMLPYTDVHQGDNKP